MRLNLEKLRKDSWMKIWFVSRHQGAIEWMKAQSDCTVDHWVEHLDVSLINQNDIVIGILPLPLVADVCAKGAIFYALVMNQSREQRGIEHSLGDMLEAKSHLMRYYVEQLKN